MNFLDWLGLSIMLTTLIGAQIQPADFNDELTRTTPAQSAAQTTPASAALAMGGEPVMRLTDSGVNTGLERAIETRELLNRAIAHYDLPHHYVPLGLHVEGERDFAQIYYLDLRVATVTQTDAKLNGAATAKALAETWRTALNARLKQLPSPVPNGWLAAVGRPTASLMVSDPTLANTVAESMAYRPGQRVTVRAEAGTIVLEGSVATEAERGRLLRMVRQVPGVMGVVDRTALEQ